MLDRLIQLCIENKARLTISDTVVNVFINNENWIATCVYDSFEDNVKACIKWFWLLMWIDPKNSFIEDLK